MKVFLKPTGLMSRAMYRVADVLTRYAPEGVDVVRRAEHADLRIMHVIGPDMFPFIESHPDLRFAVIQYCFKSAGGDVPSWQALWKKSKLVWSYYDLPLEDRLFYCAPLGVDSDIFTYRSVVSHGLRACAPRSTGVMTSGYITGPGTEAIEEVALAAERIGLSVLHLGPVPVYGHDTTRQMTVPGSWRSMTEVSDETLAEELGQCKWVSGLRYVEGFELPAVEGLFCGARPIVFDRPEMRRWYDGHAVFVPEYYGQELVNVLAEVLLREPCRVTPDEHERARETFNWKTIAEGFWTRLMENVS